MKSFKYSNRPKSYITIKVIDDPYSMGGGAPEPVVSVGCTLKADFANPTWKVHIPMDLAEAVGRELMSLAQAHGPCRPGGKRTSRNQAPTSRGLPQSTPEPKASGATAQDVDQAILEGRIVRRKKGGK